MKMKVWHWQLVHIHVKEFFFRLNELIIKEEKNFFCCLSCRSAAKQKGSWVTAVLDHLLPPAGWTLRLHGGRLSETPLTVTSTFLSGTHFSAFCFIKNKYFRMCFSSQAVSHNSLVVSLNSSHFNMEPVSVTSEENAQYKGHHEL